MRVECKRIKLMRHRSEGYLLTMKMDSWPPDCEYLATVEVNANEDSQGMLTSTKVINILDKESSITEREIIEYFEYDDDVESESLYSSLLEDDEDDEDEDDPADDWKRG